MDKHYYNPENIEAFIGNRLSASDKIDFENAIAKDPLLKNEVDLQHDIIESLKNSRKAELKTRLNNIDVSSAPSFSGAKIAASVLVAGLMGYGIYSYFNSAKTPNTTITKTDKGTEVVVNQTDSQISTPSSQGISDSKSTSASKSGNDKATNANTTVTKNTQSTSRISSNPAPIVVPEPADMDNEHFQNDESLNIPEGKIAQETSIKNNLDIKEDNSTSHKFHYKFYNNKLFLYGNFSEKTYEILELNTRYNGKQVYLYYDNSYYLLKSNQLEITQLKKITDKKVLDEIKNIGK